MNVKMKKVLNDIEKAEQKIGELQEKLKALHKERIDLENLEMIDFLRKNKVSHKDLQKVIDTYHEERGATVPIKTEYKEEYKSNEI